MSLHLLAHRARTRTVHALRSTARRGGAVAAAVFLVLEPGAARCEAPNPSFIFPQGGPAGTTFEVEAGKFDSWPVEVFVNSPKIHWESTDKEGVFRVTIDSGEPAQPFSVRFFNQDGASRPFSFETGRIPETVENEPNDAHSSAEPIESLPIVVNGRLNQSGDVDSFAVTLKAGQWLVADLACYRLGSPVDPFLHLTDASGYKLAFGNDSATLDPLLSFQCERDGVYSVQVAGFAFPPKSTVSLTGGSSCVYRLRLTTGPYIQQAFPPALASASRAQPVQLLGWNLSGTNRWTSVLVEPRPTPIDGTGGRIPVGPADMAFPFLLESSALPGDLEIEPNHPPAAAHPIVIPSVTHGRIDPAGDEDVFTFHADKDQELEFEIIASNRNSPLDAVVSIENADGKSLTVHDDTSAVLEPDPRFVWKAPATGDFRVRVADLTGAGGDDFIYSLHLSTVRPGFSPRLDRHSLRLEPANDFRDDVTVEVERRHGHNGPLAVAAIGLPDGVTVTAPNLAPGQNTLRVSFTAATNAAPANASVRLILMDPAIRPPAMQTATFDFLGKDHGGRRFLDETEDLWLTVKERPPAEPAGDGAKNNPDSNSKND